jgi:hypothetical protein
VTVDLGAIVNFVTTVALIGGLFFAAFEWRAQRAERRREAQMLLVRSFDSPEYTRALRRVMELPPDLTGAQIREALGPDDADLVWFYLGAMESMGILVHARQLDLRLVDQLHSQPILTGWDRLRHYVADVRAATGRETMHEWFQWLAERIAALEHEEGRVPAHIGEKDWRS